MPAPKGNHNARKEAPDRLSETVRVRMTWDDRASIITAAKDETLSEWARRTLVTAAKKATQTGTKKKATIGK